MMLESRLKVLLKKTEKGRYTTEAVNSAVTHFLNDIANFCDLELFSMMTDSMLMANYLMWEMIALRNSEAENRLEEIKQSLRISLIPSESGLIEKPEPVSSNVVSLFSKTVH